MALILLVLADSMAWTPMEPAKKTLIIMAHGINPIQGSLYMSKSDEREKHPEDYACNDQSGAAHIWKTYGMTPYLEKEVTGTFNHTYAQAFSFGNASPVDLAHDLADRTWSITRECNGKRLKKSIKYGEVVDDVIEVSGDQTLKSFFEQATLRWFHGEVLKSRSVSGNQDPEIDAWLKAYWAANGNADPTLDQLRASKPSLVPSRFIVIAHSMGGLDTREYIHSNFYNGDIDKLVTLDSPMEGSYAVDQNQRLLADGGLEYIAKPTVQAAGQILLASALLTIPVPDGIQDATNNLADLIFWGSLQGLGWEIFAKYVASIFLATGYGYNDGANLYLSPGSAPLKHINSMTAPGNPLAPSPYPFPAFRVFHEEGIPCVGDPDELSGDSYVMGSLVPKVYEAAWKNFYVSGGRGYKQTDEVQQLSNTLIATLVGAVTQINLNQQGSIVVPHWSSFAADVAAYNQPTTDIRRHLFSISGSMIDVTPPVERISKLGLYLATSKLENMVVYAAMDKASKWPNLVYLKWVKPVTGIVLTTIANAAIDKALAQIPGAKENGLHVPSFFDLGSTASIAPSHDYSTINSTKETVKDARTVANPQTGATRSITPTVLEDFLYEKPYVTLEFSRDGDMAVPEIRGSNQATLLRFPSSALKPITYSATGWEDRMAVREEQHPTVQGTTSTVRRVTRLLLPNELVVSNFPAQFRFQVEDLRPDLMEQFTFSTNYGQFGITWDRVGIPGDANYGKYKVYRWRADGTKTFLKVDDAPITDKGVWVFKPADYLETAPPKNENLSLVFRDGQNAISITMTNHAGMTNGQRFFLMFQATEPLITMDWPLPYGVVSSNRPELRVQVNALSYPGIDIDPAASWFKIYARSESGAEDGAAVPQQSFATYETLPGGNRRFRHTLTAAQSIPATGNYWLEIFVASRNNMASAGASRRRIPFTYDGSIPVLSLQAPADGANPDRKNLHLRFSYDDAPLHSLQIARAQVLNSIGQVIFESKPMAALSSGGGDVVWDGKAVGGAVPPDGTYTLRLTAKDQAASDAAGVDLAQAALNLVPSQTDGSVSAAFEAAWTAMTAHGGANIATAEGGFYLDRTEPLFELVSRTERISSSSKQTVSYKVADGSAALAAQKAKVRWILTQSGLNGAADQDLRVEQEIPLAASSLGAAPVSQFKEEENGLNLRDGRYTVAVEVEDPAGNRRTFQEEAWTFFVDRTAPRISGMFTDQLVYNSQSPSASPKLTFIVDEEADAPDNRMTPAEVLARITASVRLPNGTVRTLTVVRASANNYEASLPADALSVPGELSAEVAASDIAGNSRTEAITFSVDTRPPRITYPEANAVVSGKLPIFGLAAPITLRDNAFLRYELQWMEAGGGAWQTAGIAVPIGQRGTGSLENVSLKPLNTVGLLGYWDVSGLSAGPYQLRLTVVEQGGLTQSVMRDVEVSPSPANPFAVSISGLPAADFVPGSQGLSIGVAIDPGDLDMTWESNLLASRSYTARISLVDATGAILKEATVTPLKTSVFLGAPSTTPDAGVYLWNDGSAWTLKVNQAPAGFRFLIAYSGDQAMQAPCPAVFACQDVATTPAETNIQGEGKVKINRQLEVSVAPGVTGQVTFVLPSDATFMPLLSASGEAEPMMEGAIFFAGKYRKRPYVGNLGPGAGTERVPLTILRPVPSSYNLEWNGFRPDGSFPSAGAAKVAVDIIEEGTRRVSSAIGQFNIGTVPLAVTASANPAVLKLEPGSPFSNITFHYGLFGAPAYLTAYIRNPSDPFHPVYTFFTDRLHADRRAEDAYSAVWNGLDRSNLLVDDIPDLEFVIEARTAPGGTPIASHAVDFSVELTKWVKSTGTAMQLRILESDPADATYVRAEPKFRLAADLRGTLADTRPFNYGVDYSGTQKVLAYPAKRFDLFVRRHREQFKAQVIGKITTQAAGYRNAIWSGCPASVIGNRTYFFRRTVTFKKGVEEVISEQIQTYSTSSRDYVFRCTEGGCAKDLIHTVSFIIIPYDRYVDETASNFITEYENLKTTASFYSVDDIQMFDNEIRYPGPSYARASDTWINPPATRTFTSQHFKTENKPIKFDPLDDANCPPFDATKKPGEDPRDANKNGVMDKGDRCVDNSAYDPNKNMVQVRMDYPAGESKFIYRKFDHGTCAPEGHIFMGFTLKLTVPDEYWDAPFGYNNLANACLRFDPANKTVYGPDGYFARDFFDNNNNGPADNLDPQEKVGEITPFDRHTFRYAPFGKTLWGGISTGSQQPIVTNGSGLYGDMLISNALSFGVADNAYVPSERWDFGFNGDEKLGPSSQYTATISSLSCSNTTGVCPAGSPATVLGQINSVSNNWSTNPFQLTSFIGLPPNFQSLVNFVEKDYKNLVIDVRLKAKPAELFQGSLLSQASMVWPASPEDVDAKNVELSQDAGNPRRVYKAVSGVRYGIGDGFSDVSNVPSHLISPASGYVDAQGYFVQDVNGNAYPPGTVPVKSGSISFPGTLADDGAGNLSFVDNTHFPKFANGNYSWVSANHGSNVEANSAAISVPSGITYAPVTVGGQNQIRFTGGATRAWSGAEDPHLASHDLDGDGFIGEDPLDNHDADGDGVIDEDPYGAVESILRFQPGSETQDYALSTDLYIPSAVNPGASDRSLFKFQSGSWAANGLVHDLVLQGLSLRYLDGTIMEASGRSDLELDVPGSTLPVPNPSAFTVKVRRRAGEGRPRELVTVLGTASDNYTLYSLAPDGSLEALSPIPLRKPVVGAERVLGYFDVSKIQGAASLLLAQESAGQITYRKLDVKVGGKILGGSQTSQVAASLYGEAEAFFPPGAVSADIPVTVRVTSLAESGLLSRNNLSIIGPVVEILPSMTFPAGAQPQVKISMQRAELGGIDPANLKIYKPDGEDLQELGQIHYTFFAAGTRVCGQDQNGDNQDGVCNQPWDRLVVTGTTSSFSHFVLLDKNTADVRPYTVTVNPQVSPLRERELSVQGMDVSSFDMYVDDDPLFREDADALPPADLAFDDILEENPSSVRGTVTIQEGRFSYITVVPHASNSRFKTIPAELIQRPEFTYLGDPVIRVTDGTELPISLNYISNGVGTVDLELDGPDRTLIVEGLPVPPRVHNYGFLLWDGKHGGAPIGEGRYASFINFTTQGGWSIRVPGPEFIVDRTAPTAFLSGAFDRNDAGGDLRLRASFADESGVASAHLKMLFGPHNILAQDIDPSQAYVGKQSLFEPLFLSCSGCAFNGELTVTDLNGNARTVTWLSEPVISAIHRTLAAEGGILDRKLADYPMAVRVDAKASWFDFNRVEEDASDVWFEDENGVRLHHRVGRFDKAAKNALFWVTLPAVPSGRPVPFTMHWADAAGVPPVAADSNSNFVAVWNFDAMNPGLDVSGMGNHGAVSGAVSAPGLLGEGLSFSGTGSKMTVASSTSLSANNALSVSAWVKVANRDDLPATPANLVSKGTDWAILLSRDKVVFQVNGESLEAPLSSTGTDGWRLISCTYESGSGSSSGGRIHLDGRQIASGQLHGGQPISSTSAGLTVGGGSSGVFFKGVLDEMRISRIAYPAAWFLMEYETQKPAPQGVRAWVERLETPAHYKWLSLNTSPSGLNLPSTLADFPVRVDLNRESLPGFGETITSANIAFADENGNYLPFDIETWNPGENTASIWVRLRKLPAGRDDFKFALLYGEGKALAINNPQAAWSPRFRGVWHFGETGARLDAATGQSGNLTMDITDQGISGKSLTISQSGNGLELPSSPSGVNLFPGFTLEGWYLLPSSNHLIGNQGRVLSKEKLGGGEAYALSFERASNGLAFGVQGQSLAAPANSIGYGQWHQVVATLSPTGEARLYKDGVSVSSSNLALQGGLEWNNKSAWIGRRSDLSLGAGFFGRLDEVRIHQIDRDASWVAANYGLQSPGNSSLVFGGESEFSDDIFIPEPPAPPLEIKVRDAAAGTADASKPEIQIVNNGENILSDLVLRLYVSRSEAPGAEVSVDPYASEPCGVRYRVTLDAVNPNLLAVDAILPPAFLLAPGQSTAADAIRFGLHFNSATKSGWDKSNDPSFQGVGSTAISTDRIVVYDRFGNILFGQETDPSSVPSGPVPPATASRISLKPQSLYYFHEGYGSEASDVSGTGIPLDLGMSGTAVGWVPAGGVDFPAENHASILENRTANAKLFNAPIASNQLALEAWIEPGNLTQSSARIIDFAAADGAQERNFRMVQNAKNVEFALRTSNGMTITLVTANNPLATAGQRYHVVATYSPYLNGNGGMRIYVNGALAAQNTEAGTLLASGTNAWNPAYILAVGNRPTVKDRGWQGKVRLAAIYSSTLSSAQVTQNYQAGLKESPLPPTVRVGVTCGDRLLPSDIVDGTKAWTEDKSAASPALSMGGLAVAKGIGGAPGTSGATSFLIYDLESEKFRLGLPTGTASLSGFTGRQDGAGAANTSIKMSSAIRKPSDQDWLGNTGSVIPLFSSNGASSVPLDLDLSGARWLWLGQSASSGTANPQGVFGNVKLRIDAADGVNPQVLSGLEYRYYEGVWTSLPNFATLTPDQKGMVGNFDLAPRLRNDNFAFEFSGYITISAAGTYTFFTESDDGSKLYIDAQQVVNNDGAHSAVEASGTVFLMPGLHAIRVTYFEKDGSELLKVRYQGPSIPKGVIPNNVLFRPGPGAGMADGRVVSGLQSFYLFRKEAGPSVHDLARSGLPLDLNLVGSSAQWLEGAGISFPGTNHNAVLENRTPNPKLFNALTETDEITLEAWIETPNLGQTGHPYIMRYGASTGADDRNFAIKQQGGNLWFAIRTANGMDVALATTNSPLASPATRYHVVMTYSPSSSVNPDGGMRIYVNGVLCASNTESGVLKNSGTNAWNPSYVLSIGNRPGALDRDWEGKLHLAAVYERALNSEQVQANFRAGVPTHWEVEAVPFGVYSQDRLLPWDYVTGGSVWTEDASPAGGAITMSSVGHPLGLAGQPQVDGEASWMLYDLESERQALGLAGSPLRLTGFAGAQDATGTVQIRIKTSAQASPPSVTDWINNGTGITERAVIDNGSNFPIDIGLNGARWVWLQESAEGAPASGYGVLGDFKAHFGPESGPAFVPGLAYSYYEGTWSAVPEMDALSPKKSGYLPDVDLSPKMRGDNFAFEFKGFIQILTAGSYTFYTSSDDGSKLYVDGVQVVNNDGLHGVVEASGTVTLSAGYHAIKIRYIEATGGETLNILYQGPSLSKRKVPAGVLFHSDTYGYGMNADYFQGSWNTVPDFESMTPTSSDIRSNFLISPRAQSDNFGFAFKGFVYAPAAGSYTFFTSSDDGSLLYVDGAQLVNNDGLHGMQERSCTVALSEGFHLIRVAYFDKTGGEGLSVMMQGPGMAKMAVPTELLFKKNFLIPIPAQSGKDGAITLGGENADVNYTIAGTQWFKLPLLAYSNNWANSVVVALDDMNGTVMQGQFQFENGSPQTLNNWYQSFTTPYTRQNEAFFTITVPGQRLYKVRWWFEL